MHQTEQTPATAHAPVALGTGTAAQATTAKGERREPMATVSLIVTRERVRLMGTLVMGGAQTVLRTWDRQANGMWKCRDPEFIAHEERIGIELAEFLDGMAFPFQVAAMLPRLPVIRDAAARAAEEVRRG